MDYCNNHLLPSKQLVFSDAYSAGTKRSTLETASPACNPQDNEVNLGAAVTCATGNRNAQMANRAWP